MPINFGMMPYGIESALALKYGVLAQQAKAQETAANAEANLNNVRAGLLPSESDANVGLTRAQTGLTSANARNVDENTKFVKPLAEASIFNTKAQGTLYGQQAYSEYQLNRLSPTLAGGKGRARGSGLATFDGFDQQLQSILREGLGYH